MNDTQSSSTGSGGETLSPPDAHERSGESWFERLMVAVGLRQSTSDLRESLETVLEQDGTADEVFSSVERTMIRNILQLRETRVEDVMLPRSAIDAVDLDTNLAGLMAIFASTGHSRMPVYRDSLDDALGMIHVRDLMNWIARSAGAVVVDDEPPPPERVSLAGIDLSKRLSETELVRPVLFVPQSMPVTDLLAKMQASRTQIALVIDEYGGVDGLVSLEDIVETVVGDIEDEHDTDEDEGSLQVIGEGQWIADGSVLLEEASERTGIDFSKLASAEDVDTLGGLAFALFGRVPNPGERQETEDLPGVVFEIVEADKRRIKRLRLRLASAKPASAPEPTAQTAAGGG
ncbi:MAG: hemolysin family protein [Ancalomicrobiaceae bacterium]|nr:hemolysin family protein [Ancalomicrobiaceae bacterium]